MMHARRAALIAGLVTLVGAAIPSANAGETDRQHFTAAAHEDSAQSQADLKEVVDAVLQIRDGKIQQAIDGPLTDVVDRYQKAYGKSKDVIFSARGPIQGMLYMSMTAMGHFGGAGNGSGKAIDVGPAWAMAYWGRGYGYSEMNRFKDAEVELRKAIALSPRDAQYASELAFALQMQGRFAESLALFEQVPGFLDTMDGWEEANKTEFRCKSFRGQGYDLVELHRLDEAEKAYNACLALVPNEPKSLGELEYIKGLRNKGG